MSNFFEPVNPAAVLMQESQQVLASLKRELEQQLRELLAAHPNDPTAEKLMTALNNVVAYQAYLRRQGQPTNLPLDAQRVDVSSDLTRTLPTPTMG